MKTVIYRGPGRALHVDDRVLERGVPGEVTNDQAARLADDPRVRLAVFNYAGEEVTPPTEPEPEGAGAEGGADNEEG